MMTKTLKLPQVIAVDGPSASGKGTLSRRMARELGYIYVDSGAMYRTLAWHCLQRGIRLEKPMTEADEKAAMPPAAVATEPAVRH
jgi:cytidylate kinase